MQNRTENLSKLCNCRTKKNLGYMLTSVLLKTKPHKIECVIKTAKSPSKFDFTME